MRLADNDRNLIAFLATLLTIGLMSKIGGTGADLAIMTALAAIAGTLATNFRKSIPPRDDRASAPIPSVDDQRP